MSNENRAYTKRKRAEQEAQTRARIAESAMELHGTVGPAQTTISAIAEQAGVRRATVYRHFPDEEALYAACSSLWSRRNPPPDSAPWRAIADPHARMGQGLRALYGYYRGNGGMLGNVLRDRAVVEPLQKTLEGFNAYLAAVRDVLMVGRSESRSVRAAICHATAFATWRSLAEDCGLNDDEAAALMALFVEAAGQSRPPQSA